MANATAHADIIVHNVRRYIAGKPVTRKYKSAPERIVITNGKVCFTSLFVRYLDGRLTLFARAAVLDTCHFRGELSLVTGMLDSSSLGVCYLRWHKIEWGIEKFFDLPFLCSFPSFCSVSLIPEFNFRGDFVC